MRDLTRSTASKERTTRRCNLKTSGALFNTDYGFAAVAWSGGKIVRVILPCRSKSRAIQKLEHGLENLEIVSDDPPVVGDLKAFFRGEQPDFSGYELDLSGLGPFHRKALIEARRIPYGETVAYGELAGRLGKPGAARAVGAAMSGNPVPILIPCHRVVGSDGSMRGFTAAGGIGLKKKLLQMESG